MREKGVFATPNPNLGHPIAPKTADLVRGFYESDDVSRIMPGKKDFVSVKQGEQRVHAYPGEIGPKQLARSIPTIQR